MDYRALRVNAEKGRNNPLRINGLGTPYSFIKKNKILNAIYGEDYAICLQLSGIIE